MCGFAGIVRAEARGVSEDALVRMASAVRHRGPDGFGLYRGRRVGLAHVRLSVVDPEGGAQPMSGGDGRVVVVFNGEIYNHVELRRALEARGHRFRTRSDTEVLVHAYEEWSTGMLDRLNGQFAFAIYDGRSESVLLARDRFGIRPLFLAERGGDLVFGSEVKAILASGEIEAAPDLRGLDEVFTFWAARAPRTPFRGITALEPGCYAVWRDGRLRVSRYYALGYGEAGVEPADALDRLDELLRGSVAFRMRADVPVGGYLSGGLDSTITCTLAAGHASGGLRTLSVAFADPAFDEGAFQRLVAGEVGSRHEVRAIAEGDIARVFPEVVRHAETPLLRTAPAPLYLLAGMTREQGVKVVLSGEGADELFLGYDLFKEVAVRLFCLRDPGSQARPRLFDRLYPYLAHGGRAGEFWRRFFLEAGDPGDPLFSHLPRFRLTARAKEFYSAELRAELAGFDALAELRDALPPAFAGWPALHRAAYLEMTTLLEPYLLASQGDRMAMAHGVEARVPFLDHRLFEFAAALPPRSKLRGLREKDVLRRWAAGVVPPSIARRPKQPYRAPDAAAFFGGADGGYVADLLAPDRLRRTGLFDPTAVAGLLRRCATGRAVGFRENQAFVGILSTQLWYDAFFEGGAAVASSVDGLGMRPEHRIHEWDAVPV